MITRYGIHRMLRVSAIGLCALVVLGYGLFATHDFIIGPTIAVYEPENGSTFSQPDIRIHGIVERIQDISLNGRSITIDDKGNWNEAVLLAPGYNVFELVARDKFGRTRNVRLELVYEVN